MDDLQDHYPTRMRTKEARDKYVSTLIERLETLRDDTDPSKGQASEEGKDIAAFQALKFAGKLVDVLAGWAVDHQVGLASQELEFLPLGPAQVRDLPAYENARSRVDIHRHEVAGGIYRNGEPIPSNVARRVAVSMLHTNSGGMPRSVASELRSALQALELNDVRPMVQPNLASRKVSFEEQRLQLAALAFVHFRRATKLMNAAEAEEQVSQAYAVSRETVRTWERRLREEMGELQVSRVIGFAKNAGSSIDAKRSVLSDASAAFEADSDYGPEALRLASIEYKARRQL